ncbi:hypothetical protein MOMMJLID_CDS0041 [Arthrobacter phage 1191A]|nr:hypothetical protein MOMMJLID_CDS0041 [Arthrobacter phage 1191A]
MNTPLNTDAVTAVARALNEAGWTCYEGGMEPGKYDGCEDCQEVCNELARKALAAYLAVAQPVVNSVEELDKLPVGTVLRDRIGWIWEIQDVGEFITTGSEYDSYSQEVNRPARVLYRPEVPGA